MNSSMVILLSCFLVFSGNVLGVTLRTQGHRHMTPEEMEAAANAEMDKVNGAWKATKAQAVVPTR